MTLKEDAILIKQTRRANLDFLKKTSQESYRRFRNLKTLHDRQKEIGLSEAIALIESGKTLEVIDASNIEEKLAEFNPVLEEVIEE